MQRISIRPAEADDYEGALVLWRESDAHHVRLVPDIFRWASDEARPRSLFKRLVKDRNRLVLVAADGGNILGLLVAELQATAPLPLFRPARIAFVNDVVVARKARRRGLGRALMEGALEWARSREVARVELNVYEANEEAIRFYESIGYRTTRRIMTRSEP